MAKASMTKRTNVFMGWSGDFDEPEAPYIEGTITSKHPGKAAYGIRRIRWFGYADFHGSAAELYIRLV